jgi:hypothetical protein
MLTCQQCRIEIETNAPRETLSARATEHLDTCAACHVFWSERQSLRRLLGELEPVAAPPDFEFRLRARMAQQSAAAGPLSWPLFAPRFAGLALASCLVLAFAAALNWRTSEPPTPAGVPGAQPGTAQVGPQPAPQPTRTEVAAGSTPTAEPNAEPVGRGGLSRSRKPSGRAPSDARAAARPNPRKPTNTNTDVNDIGVKGATLVARDSTLDTNAAQTGIPVPASAKPLQFLVKDVQGAARMISVEPVSFGSRDLLGGRTPPRVVNASYTRSNQGVW